MQHQRHQAFTLIELLVTIGVISLLIAIIIPSLSGARDQAKNAVCVNRLKGLGGALYSYANENNDYMLPGRMPPTADGTGWLTEVNGGLKFRPTFLAMLGTQLGTKPFEVPLTKPDQRDPKNQKYNRQNYADELFVCPVTPDWVDERNGSYGYNYQFLGNARLSNPANPTSFKNWPNSLSRVRNASGIVMMGDGMGTAASFATRERREYSDNSTDPDRFGNEGFNLDPPVVDPTNGEMANFSTTQRSSLHDRHNDKATVVWLDGHTTQASLFDMGYDVDPETGIVGLSGRPNVGNKFWSTDNSIGPWIQP